MKIAIDLDKTLIDCDSFIYWVANKFFSKPSEKNLKFNLIFTGNEGSDGLISKFLSKFSKMGKPESYFQIPNAIDVVNSWYDKGIEIYILSSRPNFSSLNYALHQYFLKMNLKYSAMIVNCNNKASFCERFNIDLLSQSDVHPLGQLPQTHLPLGHHHIQIHHNGHRFTPLKWSGHSPLSAPPPGRIGRT